MEPQAADIARRLAAQAEAVCRHYLSQGRREGRYWLVGDARNTAGRSLYVRLAAFPDGHGAAGKWTDAATGDHGDLLDIIARVCGHARLRDTLEEARRFLSLPMPDPAPNGTGLKRRPIAPTGTPEAARRLIAACGPIAATSVEEYLRHRALRDVRGYAALRFHPRCHYRPCGDDAPGVRTAWPAMIAAVTDLDGVICGVHRTWLDPISGDKAPVATPRRAMGHLLGNGVRLGKAGPVMAAGEGIETMLSLRAILPAMPMIAGLSSAHLAAILFPTELQRLYVARDADPAGDAAMAALVDRAASRGIDVVPLSPVLGDFNEDLMLHGRSRMRAATVGQLLAADVRRYLVSA